MIWSPGFRCEVAVIKAGHRASDQMAIFVYQMEIGTRVREYRIERKLSGKTTIYERNES